MASQYQEEESLFQEKQNQDQKIRFLYLPKEDMPTKQERQERTLSVVQNLLKGLVNTFIDLTILTSVT